MTRIKVTEGSRGVFSKKYGLGISTVIDDENPIEKEIRHVNEAMINWFKSRGTKCGEMVFVFLSDPSLHDSIMAHIERLIDQDFEYANLAQAVSVEVVLGDMTGKECREFKKPAGR